MTSRKRHWVLRLIILGIIMTGGIAWAGGPLPVIVSEEGGDDDLEETWNYIDNQAYLRNYEKSRMNTPAGAVGGEIIRYGDTRRRPGFGLEFNNGSTQIIYYDGYRPNCCYPRQYIVVPPPSKPHRDPRRDKPSKRR